ncbi:hypothetical protein [Haloferula sp. A504]|uniref:hypothetical protein n=1 Tax=Haloferula sp. A504 TaxID=3373601 RepID=UPI0031BE0A79|nr:hypothetical protein [Verrucomicrobiaceae bacterium E54]
MPDSTPCSRCGAPTELHFGDRPICEDCYTALASCCAGEFEESSEEPPIMKSASSIEKPR